MKRRRPASISSDDETAPRPPKRRKLSPRRRRAKKPKIRALWTGWKEVYLCGTELDEYDKVYDRDWDFTHLKDALDDGSLKKTSRFVYVFGTTEPQMLPSTVEGEAGEVVLIPVLVAVVGDVPPPSELGVNSVQMRDEAQRIVSFREMKMTWTPYFTPHQERNLKSQLRNPSVFFLHCNLRQATLRRMPEKDRMTYSYLLPYLVKPRDLLQIDDSASIAAGIFQPEQGGGCVNFEVDIFSDPSEKTRILNAVMVENDLDLKYRDGLKVAMKNAIVETKTRYQRMKTEAQARFDAIPAETRDQMNRLEFVKFYPSNEVIRGCKSPFINRYFGRASAVFPQDPAEDVVV